MNRNAIITVLAVTVLAAMAPATQGQLIENGLTAEIDNITDAGGLLQGILQTGDILQGSYTYNSATPDKYPASDTDGDYIHRDAAYGITLNGGNGAIFQSDSSNLNFQIQIRDNDQAKPGDRYVAWSQHNLSLYDGVEVNTIWCEFLAASYDVLDSDALPDYPPNLDNWSESFIFINGRTIDADGKIVDYFEITAQITSVTLIPEPATLILLGLGGMLIRKRIS